MPDVAAVLRSLLGVVAVAVVALHWGPPGSATAAAVAAAIAGATALQDSPRGRILLVVGVSLLMGSAVLLGALTSAYSALFVAIVAIWSFGAAMPWALGVPAGSIAAASTALVVVAAPDAPTTSSTLRCVRGRRRRRPRSGGPHRGLAAAPLARAARRAHRGLSVTGR